MKVLAKSTNFFATKYLFDINIIKFSTIRVFSHIFRFFLFI